MIACILVLFNPDFGKFRVVIDSIVNQADWIIIIDNSDINFALQIPSADNIQYIPLEENRGIAAAQNIGIREAMRRQHKYMWLSDQDTIYPDRYTQNMLAVLKNHPGRISSIAPAYFDTNKGEIQCFIDHRPFTTYFIPKPGINAVSHAIASGIIIPTAVLEIVGLMQEDLFIDWVDLEWCWRAKYRFGYQNLGVGDVVIAHTMGDTWVKFFNRKVSFRTPIRHYYMIRNAVHLAMHSKSAGPAIRLEIFSKAILWAFIFPAISRTAKIAHAKATVTGFLDGFLNRMGARPS